MNTVRKPFTIRHRCIIIKRFVKNFLQDILMKCFAVSFFDNSAAAYVVFARQTLRTL